MNWIRHLEARGALALFGTILCWGAVPVLLRELTNHVDAWTANAIRFPAAAVLYWPVLYLFYRRGKLSWGVVRQCLIPTIFVLIAQVFWALAPYYLPASAIGFMVRLTMVFSILFAMIFVREERRLLRVWPFYLGVAMSVIGFVLLSMAQGYAGDDIHPMGIVCMLICSVCLGMYAVTVRVYMKKVHPLLGFGIVSQFVSAGLLIAAVFQADWSSVATLSASGWTMLLVSSFLGIATAHSLMYVAIHRLGNSITAGVQNLTPFVTVLLAMAFLDEGMTTLQWTGGFAIILGAWWLLKSHTLIEKRA